MSDEGLHEIQLNGKQLVFLFMTATVVAVVIFLCGVMVGRGVPAQRGTPVLAADGSDPTTTDEARNAGRKGGEVVSRDRVHMAAIGREGGEARGRARSQLNNGNGNGHAGRYLERERSVAVSREMPSPDRRSEKAGLPVNREVPAEV